MKNIKYIAGLLLMAGVLLCQQSCKKNETAVGTTPMPFAVPNGFPAPVYDFETNPVTREGFELGRKLFYDGRLSKDGNFPCASCHQQFAAFATYDHDLSHGFNDQFTTRNAPGLFNMAWQTNFHWDGGINHIELQPLAPITAPNEMAEDINNVITKLKADKEYQQQFSAAFGAGEINSQKMLKALSQFMVMIVSADSKYDQYKKGMAVFSTYELEGYQIFKAKCNSCHTEPLFTNNSYRNNGLILNPSLKDYGRMRITGNASDSLKFKVPSLRNVAITFPYMHDGRFYSIGQVLEHYNSGIVQSATLDQELRSRIPLSFSDKIYLQAFLKTLTDSSLLSNKKLIQP